MGGENFQDYVTQITAVGDKFGPIVLKAVVLLVLVLLLTIYLGRGLASILVRLGLPERRAAMSVTALHILVLFVASLVVLNVLGFPGVLLFRIIVVILMVLVALFIIVRPYIPRLPLKKGDVVSFGGKVGKVEDISIMYTQLKTFDAKLIFIPNHKVMNDMVINFSAKPKRRVDINFFIPYEADLVLVKQLVMAALEDDKRVQEKPKPKVVISSFSPNYREMQARFWVERKNAITAKWDLNEVIDAKLTANGIAMAAPRLTLIDQRGAAPAASPAQAEEEMEALAAAMDADSEAPPDDLQDAQEESAKDQA